MLRESELVADHEFVSKAEALSRFRRDFADLAGVIDDDVLWSCTNCGACVDQCPTDIEHIDHIAQLVGTSRHCGIGTDLDGGFGTEQAPRDLNTIADLQNLAPLLRDQGFSDEEVSGIFSGNWLRLLGRHWKDTL